MYMSAGGGAPMAQPLAQPPPYCPPAYQQHPHLQPDARLAPSPPLQSPPLQWAQPLQFPSSPSSLQEHGWPDPGGQPYQSVPSQHPAPQPAAVHQPGGVVAGGYGTPYYDPYGVAPELQHRRPPPTALRRHQNHPIQYHQPSPLNTPTFSVLSRPGPDSPPSTITISNSGSSPPTSPRTPPVGEDQSAPGSLLLLDSSVADRSTVSSSAVGPARGKRREKGPRREVRIHISGLPLDVTAADVASLFQPFGKLVGVEVLRGCKGEASATYSEAAAAKQAVDHFHGKVKLQGARGAMQVAVENAKLYVANLPLTEKEESLRRLFAPYGDLCDIVILGARKEEISLGCAFVRYSTREAAEACIRALNGTRKFEGVDRKLTVRHAGEEGKPRGRKSRPASAAAVPAAPAGAAPCAVPPSPQPPPAAVGRGVVAFPASPAVSPAVSIPPLGARP
eukprot:Hpha_TRINITY_DN16822_c0_g19::TRINITY_DN16822_c0_g19_i1::g.149840::m.149840/K13207/CUGBP, BRUNOL, CELF; CUG-BP- and ETR3-like factor